MADWDKFPEAFDAAGIEYVEEPGWRNRGHGDLVSFNFLVLHHDAIRSEDNSVHTRVIRDGHSTLRGPLSQLGLDRQGRPVIIAQGVSWHAGYGAAMWGAPAGRGNYYSIGIEAYDSGYNTWTDAQRREYPRVVAALLKYAGLPPDRWIFHRDYNKVDGKIDPVGFTAAQFMKDVKFWYDKIGEKPTEIPDAKEPGDLGKFEREVILDEGRIKYFEKGIQFINKVTGDRVVKGKLAEDYVETWGYPIGDTVNLDSGRQAQSFKRGIVYSSEHGTYIVTGDIKKRFMELGYTSYTGFPKTGEIVAPDKEGRLQSFENGHMYWHPDTKAFFIKGEIWEEFSRIGYEKTAGYPRDTEKATPLREGSYQHFQKGSIYHPKDSQAFWIDEEIMNIWSKFGWENGRLGWPTSSVKEKEDSRIVEFENGTIEIDSENRLRVFIDSERVL